MMKKSINNRFLLKYSIKGFAGKEVIIGEQCRKYLQKGVNQLSAAVQVTLGPKGRNVIIDQTFGDPKITKDGVTVAKNIDFSDRKVNLGAALIKQVANRANNEAGDGTTTATILANKIFTEGNRLVAAGANPMDLRKGIMLAVDRVEKYLDKISVKITNHQEL